jgi:hypothetical protein
MDLSELILSELDANNLRNMLQEFKDEEVALKTNEDLRDVINFKEKQLSGK